MAAQKSQKKQTGVGDTDSLTPDKDSDKAIVRKNVSKSLFARAWGITPDINFAFNERIGTSVQFFYSERFVAAFPGVRGIRVFEDKKTILHRLSILLKSPLIFASCTGPDALSGCIYKPIWWWGRGNNSIEEFRILDDSTALLDSFEFVPRRLAAINLGSDSHAFVYLETEAMEPTGLYPDEFDSSHIRYEPYAMFRGKMINYAEHEDGYVEIDGTIHKIDERCKLRLRHTTPFNLLIAPHSSPINNNSFDSLLVTELDGILNNKCDLQSLAGKIRKLPRVRPEL